MNNHRFYTFLYQPTVAVDKANEYRAGQIAAVAQQALSDADLILATSCSRQPEFSVVQV